MPQAIIRVAKIKTAGAARGKTAHNYRLMETPNADPDRAKALNQEYLNTDRTDYWRLAEQRIGEVVTRKVRDDQVRAMEVVLTASPEWFRRGTDGQAEDMRESKWVADNLHFLKEKFGAKNVVSFTLHQDEKTPHVHAVVVPITDKNRLSADTLFNPKTLSQLQTDYAAAMAEHGLERGVAGSRRQHEDMKQVYGHQAHTAAELAPLVQPVAAQVFKLKSMPGLLNRDEWKAQQEAAINAELARQVGEANQRLEKAGNVAVAHAGGTERAEVLARQLGIAEGLKQGNFDQLQAQTARADLLAERSERLAVELAQGGGAMVEQLTTYGQQQREKARQELVGVMEGLLVGSVRSGTDFRAQLLAVGYATGKEAGQGVLVDEATGSRFHPDELAPHGQELGPQLNAAVERTLAAEYAQSAAGKLAAEQAERAARGQQAHQGRAVLEMQAKDLELIKGYFSQEGAGVRPGQVQADGRVQLEVVYHHTARHVVGVNELLEKAQKWTGVVVQEDRHDREHRQAGAKQMVATMKIEREQRKGKSQGRGVSM
jgi:hypothetical protein